MAPASWIGTTPLPPSRARASASRQKRSRATAPAPPARTLSARAAPVGEWRARKTRPAAPAPPPSGSPEDDSSELLASLLDDDLGAGADGGIPTPLLEALVERDPEGLGRTPDELYERFGFLRVQGRERPVGVTERDVLGA